MPIKEYIELLDSHSSDLMSEGKPAGYPLSVAAFVSLAVQRLRREKPAAALLFELFAYLGGEPVPVSLLRAGKDAEVTDALRQILGATIPMNRNVRELNKLGLAKLDAGQRLQVHRLVQRVLQDTMTADRADQTLRNVRNLLASANPGDADEQGEHPHHREMGPHIEPADLIHAENLDARQAVLDHARFLYLKGDYENSRLLADKAATAWSQDTWHSRLGPDGEMTLLARAQVANATRTLGDSQAAAALTRDTYDRFQRSPHLGPRHEFTLITGNQVAHDLRIAGRYREALEFERESVALHRVVFGDVETYTLRALTNLAVDHRMIGEFAEALALDEEIVGHWEDVGGDNPKVLEARMNVARSFYGMGAYRAGLDILDRWRPAVQEKLGGRHRIAVLAGRTHAITLRKAGRLTEAVAAIKENHELTESRFGDTHEFTVAAAVSRANALRELGGPDNLDEAMRLLDGALARYRTDFGESHPLTLVAQVNQAVAHRTMGDIAAARALDERCYLELTHVLGSEHPYTLCAGSSLATDYALTGESESALRLSTLMVEITRTTSGGGHDARDGGEHPYLLMRAINLAHDLRANGAEIEAEALLQESLSGLRRSLGPGHPDVVAAERTIRTEGDIEPPPT
jgi:tetratricopeptide (TPR) repeat protein